MPKEATIGILEQSMNLLPLGFLLVEASGEIVLINDYALKALGYERDELIGRSVDDLVPPGIRERHVELRREYLESPEIRPIGVGRKVNALTKSGVEVPVEASLGPVHVDGKTYVAVQLSNISAIESARRSLTELVNSIDGIIFSGDARTFHFDFVSARAEEILGYPADEWVKHPTFWPEHILEDDRQDAVSFHYGETQSRRDHRFEYRMLAADGRIVWIRELVRVVSDAGQPARMYGVMLDITKLKESEALQTKLEEKLRAAQKMESLAVLAGGIAHDFNNLLVGVLGNAGLILDDLPPESPVFAPVKRIEKAAMRAADLTHQMLAYSGKGRFVTQTIDLNRMIEEMAYLLQASISKNASIEYRLSPELPALEADATQLRQVVMNLLTNASDAIGDKVGVITIATDVVTIEDGEMAAEGSDLDDEIAPGRYLLLEVADTGCGMKKETIAKIFDPFFSTKFTGRGLGLAATLGIVRGHSGTLKVDSRPGRGTRFRILLPAADGEASAPLPGEDDSLRFRKGGRALVIDDDETVCGVLKESLERMGFEVETAPDGRSGLDLFARYECDFRIVFLDLTMPHMNGEETFHELRTLDPECIVVLMSGYNGQDVTSPFAGKGLAGFLQKPFEYKTTCRILEEVLG